MLAWLIILKPNIYNIWMIIFIKMQYLIKIYLIFNQKFYRFFALDRHFSRSKKYCDTVFEDIFSISDSTDPEKES